MKRTKIVVLIMFFVLGAMNVVAQGDRDGDGLPDTRDQCPDVAGPASNNGCPVFTVVQPQPVDSDGDGLPDSDDQCPNQAGPRENRGCPELDIAPPPSNPDSQPPAPPSNDGNGSDQPTTPDTPSNDGNGGEQPPVPDSPSQPEPQADPNTPPTGGNDVPAFNPPLLSNDGCFITPNSAGGANVRKAPLAGASVLGSLYPGKTYASSGFVIVSGSMWYMLDNYEGGAGQVGYAGSSVVNGSSICGQLDTWNVSLDWISGEANGTNDDDDGENPTVEYCIYQEVHEVGVFEEVCYEIEIPEGCVLTTSEAGVFTLDCGEGEVGQVNPLFDGLPAIDIQAPSRDEAPIQIGLQIYFNTPDTTPDGTENPTIEYCVYEEVQEAGVFEEVCYEIEIPDGCWVVTSEAGVFDIECAPEVGSNVSFKIDNSSNEAPRFPDRSGVIDDLIFCNPGDIWWVGFREPEPGQGICMNSIFEMRETPLEDGMTRLVGMIPDNDDPEQASMPLPVWEEFLAMFCEPDDWWSAQDNDGSLSGGCWDSTADNGREDTQLGLSIVMDQPEPPIGVMDWLQQAGAGGELEDVTPGHFCGEGTEPFATWEEDSNGHVVPGSVVIECVEEGFWDED